MGPELETESRTYALQERRSANWAIPAKYFSLLYGAHCRNRIDDLRITSTALLPTELSELIFIQNFIIGAVNQIRTDVLRIWSPLPDH